jgi:hypothetical protein
MAFVLIPFSFIITHESRGTHSYALEGSLTASNVQVGTNAVGADANKHQYTDCGIGFAKVQPFNAGGNNLYNPAENLIVAAKYFQKQLGDARNKAVGDARIWMAYFAYNTGGFADGTVNGARGQNQEWAARADAFFDELGLPHPN